jgi:hypothetical protein
MNNELNTQIKKLEDELAELKAIAEKKQGWWANGRGYFGIYGGGYILKGINHMAPLDLEFKAQGRVFRTKKLAEAFGEYERAVVRINDAIDAGEAGEMVPWFWLHCNKWHVAQEQSIAFHGGSLESIECIIKSHTADFAIIKRYMDLRDADVALQSGYVMGIREQIMALPKPSKPPEGFKTQHARFNEGFDDSLKKAADLAEARERELLKELDSQANAHNQYTLELSLQRGMR